MTSITGRSELDSDPSGDQASTGRLGDRVFSGLATGAGVTVIVLIVAIGAFLVYRAVPALRDDKANFLFDRVWQVGTGSLRFGIPDLLWVTVISSVVAMIIAVPVAIALALFLTQYAPRRLSAPFGYLVDLLAAVPSIIYGLWGLLILAPILQHVQTFLNKILHWFPLFGSPVTPGSIFEASIVLAIMILPIVTALSREVFAQTPLAHKEGALALGATKWEMIRTAVLPYGFSGVVSASMLGLGRALGETIAVTIIVSTNPGNFYFSLFSGGETFASKIANNASEFDSPLTTGAYIAAGLVLFILTFAVNAIARVVIERRKAFTE